MRIAQAIALYLPEFQGGATLVCDRLARSLARRGHAVEIFSGRTTAAEPLGALKRDMVGPFLTWRVNLGGAFHPWSRENWDDPVARDSFADFLAATRPDVVHAHSMQALGIGILDAARAADVPVVVTMHDWWWLCPCLFRLSPAGGMCPPIVVPERCSGRAQIELAERRDALRAALDGVVRIVTPSAYLRDSLIVNGLPAERIVVQANGTAPPDPCFARRPAPDGRLRAVFLGGAGNREKGLPVLLEAACALPDGIVVHAYSVAPDEVAPFAGSLGDRFVAHAAFAPGALDDVLAGADVVVIPSVMRESFSLVAREALARGIPVVTSDCGGPEEVVRDGENGLVVPAGVAAALASALGRLHADRALLARLAGAERPVFPTPDDQAAAAEALYDDVVREAAARRVESARRAAEAESAHSATSRLLRRLRDLRSMLGLRATREAEGASPDHASRSGAGAQPSPVTRAARAARVRPASAAPLGGKRILFLTGIDGAPLRYRVWHLVEQLALAGVESRVLYHSDEAALTAARGVDCVVLFRAPYSVTVAAVVAEARRRRAPVVFSVDDLVFRPESLGEAPALGLARPELVAGFRQSVESYARSFAAADCFLGSTEALVEAARAAGATAFLHRNGLGSPLLACAERARAAAVRGAAAGGNGHAGIRIGFFSGTDTHDRDLGMIAPPLRRVLEAFPGATLVLGGPVALPDALAGLERRVERLPFVAWSELPRHLATLDVSLAPLELPSEFNQAKSEVKYLEAGAVGVPTIASPSAAFRIATGSGASGVLAGDAEEWHAALGRLAADAELRSSLGRRARRDVYRRYSPLVQDDDAVAVFADIVARGSCREGPAPSPIPMEAGGGSCVALEPSAAVYGSYSLDAESGGPLVPGAEVAQSFVCRGDGLRRVDVKVGTYVRRNPHRVLLEVTDEAGTVLGRREVAAAKLVNDTFVSVDLDVPVEDSAGRTFVVRASAPEAREGNQILLWHAPSPLGGLSIGSVEVPGRTLAFRSFGRDAA